MYFATFLIQSNIEFFKVLAWEANKPRVNIVAVLVDGDIYDEISWEVSWYASSYIQQKLSDTKAFVLPLQLKTVSAYDIHRIMENIYFDWLEDVNSSLIWLVMIGEIPLPVVNQDWYVFPSVYPYVDFEDQKYVWDSEIKYFVPNWNDAWQAEIWHWLINYGSDVSAYKEFFAKVKKYDKNPGEFIWDAMWYEDFIAEKKWFLNENYKYYRNKIMFAEDLWYQRYSPLMKSLFNTEYTDNSAKILDDLKEVSDHADWMDFEIPVHSSDESHTTKLVQQEIDDSYLADYSELFSKVALTTRRENIFAWWRWIKTYENEEWKKSMEVDADSSMSMVQLKDTLYLWNDNLVWVIQNLNNILEKYVDDKIESEKYSMDLVIPVEYRQEKWKKIRLASVSLWCYSFVTDYKNYYFGNEARYVDNVKDFSIYRWTFRNLTWIDGLKYSDLTWWKNPVVSPFDKTDVTKKSIWASYDIFSNQVEGNRWYVMTRVQEDASEYYENKTRALDEEKTRCLKFLCKVRRKSWPSKCDEDNCETINEFALRRWWGASPINLDFDSLSESKYRLSWFAATDSWRPIFDMWWYQSLSSWKDEWISWTWWIHWTWTWPQWDATNFKSYIKYSSPTEVEWWDKRKRWYRVYYNHMPNVHDVSFSDMNYRTLSPDKLLWDFQQESDKIFTIENISRGGLLSCWSSEKYTYKFISSVVKHDSTSDDEINWIDRDLYWDTWKLWEYYADVESAYSWLYQDIQAIELSWEELVLYLDEKWLELSWYISQLKNVVLWNHIEGDVSEVLSWVDNVLSWSRSELINLYSSISSLIVDDIVGTFERIIYIEWWDLEWFYDDPDFKSSVKIPFLSWWIVNINSFTNKILDSKDSLLELYDNVYASLDSMKTQWTDFYSGYESKIETSAFSERFFELNSWFQNMFIIYPDEEEDDEVLDEDGWEWIINWVDVGDEEQSDENEDEGWEWDIFLELTSGSVLESVDLLMNSFTGTTTGVNDLFLQFFEVDKRWDQIIEEAKNDSDFKSRCREEWIDIDWLTQAELITEYANWAKWDWYDSNWAKKNHELLVWVVEHISWMNLLTPDRPIDSPRYVSMQAINGKEVKLIYPDLFKVEVFELTWKNKSGYDVHLLLTSSQIKEKLVEYIKNKVLEYNTLLKVDWVGDNDYYRKIRDFDEYATPYTGHRPYKPFTYEEFVDAIWWEQMLDVIADVLYYQNLTNKKKLSSSWVNEDISFIKKTFNINDKRENVLEDYLTEGNEEKKHPLLVIPKYELSGYEVAYVNSNGGDYIIPSEVYSGISLVEDQRDNARVKIRRLETSPQLQESNNKCNIPMNWRLPLFGWTTTWLQWFLCWWKETKESPLRIKLSFDGSLWDVIVSSWFNAFMKSLWKSLISETEESLIDWKDAMSDYGDEWETLLDSSSNSDSDKDITQSEVESERHNREVLSWNTPVSLALSNISNNVKISNSNPNLTDNNPTSLLEIASMYDVQNITMTIEWTWDWCLSLNESKICPWDKYSLTFNPKTNPFKWLVKSADHKAWSLAFDIKYGLWGEDYIEKVVKYTVSPSDLSSIEINFLDKKTVAWMLTPVEVIGRDKYNNRISWWLKKYDFKISTWRFLREWSYNTGFTTNDFRNLKFYYQAPLNVQDGSNVVFEVVESLDFDEKWANTLWTYVQPLAQWALEVQLNNKVILQKQQTGINQSFRLWEEDSIYENGELIIPRLQKLDLYMKDNGWMPIDVESQVIVNSKNWLVVLWQLQKNEEWKDTFFETSKYYMSWWHVVIYYYPTKVSWNDVIKIEIPWLETRVINLSILPAPLKNIEFRLPKEVLQLWDRMTGEVFFMDKWGNLVDSNWSFTFYYDEDKIEISGWVDWEVEKQYKSWYLSFQIIATWGGLSYIYSEEPVPSYISVMVDKHLFPQTWLNILYLNYFGDDWWNQRWYLSDNKKYIESIMKKSNKIITTTTQLVSEDKIKKMLWKIWPWFKIWNPWNQDIAMTFNWNSFSMLIWDVSVMESSLSFEWITLVQDVMESILLNTPNKSYAFFIPRDTNYKIDKWILYDWNEKIWSIKDGEISLSLSDNFLDNWDNIWTLSYKWIIFWEIIFHIPSFLPELKCFQRPSDSYLFENTFTDGSTYGMDSIWLFDLQSDFELNSNYKSIQDSDELSEQVWFLWDFKNITLFAEWEIVWEATKKFWSEFVINLWDPLLSRKTKNQNVYRTNYDWWIWQEIFVDSKNQIFWSYQINFDGDWKNDLLVIYLDWSIKLAKNYWWNPDIKNMQDLMRIAVGIEDVFVWDVDGDKLDDIIVKTENNQLRVYLNKNDKIPWEFDVDWNVACLNLNVRDWEKSTNPADISWLYKLYVEDMDKDGIMDIITYDEKWYVKVFYWWSTNWWPNYLSKEKYSCDTWWYYREIGNTTVVASFDVGISYGCVPSLSCNGGYKRCGNLGIYDNSMIHRDGIVNKSLDISELELPYYWIGFDQDKVVDEIDLKNINEGTDGSLSWAMNYVLENTDVDVLSKRWLENWAKVQDVTLNGDTVVPFIPISFLDPLVDPLTKESFVTMNPDPISVYKEYVFPPETSQILKDWDKVWVIVNIENVWTEFLYNVIFWDVIQWPWNLYFDEDDVFEWIWIIGGITWSKLREDRNEYLYKYYFGFGCASQDKAVGIMKRDWKFSYLIRKSELKPGETLRIGYELEYHDMKVKDISLNYDEYWNNDQYPDIKLQSIDGCDKDFMAFVNKWKSRDFVRQNIPLQDEIDKSYAETMARTDDYSSDVWDVGSNVNSLPGIVWDSINRIQLINAWELEVSNDVKWKKTLKNKLNDVLLNKIRDWDLESWNLDIDVDLSIFEDKVEKIENVVDDITKGMCEGFSFWWSNNCQWLPVPFNQAFFAPWKYHLFGCWELPLWKLEQWLPVFFYPGTVSGFPMVNWLKSPADSFLWAPWWVYPSMIRIYAAPTLTSQLWIAVCMSPDRIWRNIPSPISDIAGNCVVFAVKPKCKAKDNDNSDLDNPNESFSPIVETVRDTKICMQSEKGVQVITLWKKSSPFSLYWSFGGIDSSYLWVIELETSSFIGPADADVKNSIMIWDVEILWWDYDVNKIKWWIQQWIKKLLIDNWLDPQIRYIANQLTKMHVSIKLPAVKNLLGNEVEVLNKIVKNFWKKNVENTEDEENVIDVLAPGSWWNKDLISRRKSISRESLDDFNDEISNPFESLASLMNQSNIINISTEPLVVKVPFIMNEDIVTYDLYLRQWLEDNRKIVAEWSGVINSLIWSCSNRTLEEAQEMCKWKASSDQKSCIETNHQILNDKCLEKANEYRASLIEFEWGDWNKMVNQIYTNLLILQKYRNFPFEIYEWIHAIDRYMAEITSLIADTFWYLTYWTSQNAERFVWYVDAIVLMLNIIKTYQVIINFSVEWSQNCGNCAKDTYDQYSCKLSLLCDSIQLPIIQIPNFKIPNITIDISNIDLGLDIVLPEFNFQTVRIDLPQLPNLPHPPALWANIKLFDLPNIPQLPEPPHLPELPSFIPEIELDLPILPPAPELPKLPNQLEALIKVADLIWKIYCIVKWNFWLVGESSVKAKIEQLTQRTYPVDWIDNIMDFTNWTAVPIKNYGVDYEISSYVDMQVNLSDFYSFMDSLTTDINNLTTDVVNDVQNTLDKGVDKAFQTEIKWLWVSVEDVIDEVDDADFQLNTTVFGENGLIGKSTNDEFAWIKSDEIEYVDYSEAKNRLQEVLAYFRKEWRNTTLTDKLDSDIDKIENQISKQNVIESNTEWINKVRDQAIEYIVSRKSDYSGLATLIKDDYDGFLAMVDSGNYLWDFGLNSWEFLTFSVNLFNLGYSTKENLKMIKKENPYASLLDNKKDIIDWYWDAVNKNSAEDLWLTQNQYLVLHDDIFRIKTQLSNFYAVVKPEHTTRMVAKGGWVTSDATLYASANAAVVSNPKDSGYEQFVVDPVGFAAWIYEKIFGWPDDWKLAKVIYSDSFASSIWNNYFKTTREDDHDIVMWTEKAVYRKCYNQKCHEGWTHYGWKYVSQLIKEIPYEEKRIKFDSYTRLKIADWDQEVKNWKVKWQTYDSFTLSWKVEDVDAYLIKLVTRIDTSYEKLDRESKKVYYILVLPDWLERDDNNKLELVNAKKYTIKDLSWSNQLVEIANFDKNRLTTSIIVSWPEKRKWYYANIATLKFDDKTKTYNINSPWSNQIVAWKQMVGDDLEPDVEPNLYRISTDKIVSEWDDLDGYVGTNYILNVPWKDNVALSYINISKDGKILKEKYTNKPEDSLSIGVLFRTESGIETYNSVWVDQFDNKVEKVITVNYAIPDITIADVKKNDDSVSIVAELSQDIDTWNVSFQRKRGDVWKTMKTKNSDGWDFSVGPNQTIINWFPYSLGNKIALYSEDDSVIALIDPNTAEITLQNWYKDIYEIVVWVEDSAIIKLYNKNTKKFVFSLSLPIMQFVKVEAKAPYTVVDIKSNMWMFNWWKAVNKDGNYILLISPTGHLYSDYSLEWIYKYDSGLKAIELTLYEPSDIRKRNPIKVWVEVEPFEM